MYKTIEQTVAYLRGLAELTADISRDTLELFVLPSFTALDAASKCGCGGLITFGAQNVAWKPEGELTGEVSPTMLKELGIEMVCIGHSERRRVLGESNLMENQKTLCALRHGLRPILCVGEDAKEKELNIGANIVCTQLKYALQNVTREQAQDLFVAYEPVWAIGENGTAASPEYASVMHHEIKKTLIELFGEEIGFDIPVLYGDSVNLENALEFIAVDYIDGLFIGRSAWEAERFSNIIHAVLSCHAKQKKAICKV